MTHQGTYSRTVDRLAASGTRTRRPALELITAAADGPRHAADAALVSRIAAGDAAALEEAYERYGRIVHAVTHRITRDAGLAEECTQDVFVALWRRAARYDARRGSVSTWLLAIARNRAIEAVRHRARRPTVATGTSEEPERRPDSSTPDPSAAAAEADEATRVGRALAELPHEQREVIQLAYFDGLSHAEIAGAIGIPLGTVKGRMRLGLERLRRVADAHDLQPAAA